MLMLAFGVSDDDAIIGKFCWVFCKMLDSAISFEVKK